MIRAIIFDCFGVLATEAWLPFKAEHFGSDPALFEQASDISKQANSGLISSKDFTKSIASLAGVEPSDVHRAIVRNVPNEPLFDYIRELKREYKRGFLSNIAGDRLRQIFTAEQLALLDVVALSFETGFVKPQAEAYRDIAQKLGMNIGECVLIDDQQRHVAGARQAGMQAVLYKDFEQTRAELEKLLTDPKS